jgi:hypothetical protein
MTAHDWSRAVAVPARDLAGMLLWCMRYAMGRCTYAPSDVARWWKQWADAIPDDYLRQCCDDVARADRVYSGNVHGLGHECDQRTWRELAAWASDELRRRGAR